MESVDEKDESQARKRSDELVAVTRGELEVVAKMLMGIHTMGLFLNFTHVYGNGDMNIVEKLCDADNLCEPISNMGHLINEKAGEALLAIWAMAEGKAVGYKEKGATV